MGPGMVPISLKMMLSMPKANDLWMGSTNLTNLTVEVEKIRESLFTF